MVLARLRCSRLSEAGQGTVHLPVQGTPQAWSTPGAGLDEGGHSRPAWCSSELSRKLLLSLTQNGNSPIEL